jgi:hypothetical protein
VRDGGGVGGIAIKIADIDEKCKIKSTNETA